MYIFNEADSILKKCDRLNAFYDIIKSHENTEEIEFQLLAESTLSLFVHPLSSTIDDIETYLNVNVLVETIEYLSNKDNVTKKHFINQMIKYFSPTYLYQILDSVYPIEGLTYRNYIHSIIEYKPEFLPTFLIKIVKLPPEAIVKFLNNQLHTTEEKQLTVYSVLLNDHMKYMLETESLLINFITRTIEKDETLSKLINLLNSNNINKKLLNTLYDVINNRRFGLSAYTLITKYDEQTLTSNIKEFSFFDMMDIIIDYSHHYPEVLMHIAKNPNFAKFLNTRDIKTIYEEELLRMMPSSTNKHLIQNKKIINYSWTEEEWINYIEALINYIFIINNPNIKDIELIIKDCLKKYPTNRRLLNLISIFINKINKESEIIFISILINYNLINEALDLLSKIDNPSIKTINSLDIYLSNHPNYKQIVLFTSLVSNKELKCLDYLLSIEETKEVYEAITQIIINSYPEVKTDLIIKVLKSNNLYYINRLLNISNIDLNYLMHLVIKYTQKDTLEAIINADSTKITKEVIIYYMKENNPSKVLKYYLNGHINDISLLIKYYLDNHNIFGLKSCLDNDSFTEEEKQKIENALNKLEITNEELNKTMQIENYLLSNIDELLTIGLAQIVIDYNLNGEEIIHQMALNKEKYHEVAKIYYSFLNGSYTDPSKLDELYFKTISKKSIKKLELK